MNLKFSKMFWQKLFYLLLILIPFSFALNPTGGVDLSFIRILILIIFLLWLFDSLKNKNLVIDKRPRFWLLVFFIFLCAASYFWAIDQSRALRKIVFLLNFFPLYFPAYSILKNNLPRHARKSDFQLETRFPRELALKLIFWGAFAAALFGFAQFSLQFIIGLDPTLSLFSKYVSPFFLGENFSKEVLAHPSWLVNISGKTIMRAFGSFPDPHLFALYLNMTIPIGLYLHTRSPRYARSPRYLMASALILVASLLAFSRAAYLSLLAMGIFFILISSHKKIIAKFPILSLLAVTALIILLTIPNPLIKRFSDSFSLKEGSVSGRVEMLKKGYETTLDYPLTGVGIGNFSRYIEPTSGSRDPIYAHNLFLDFSSETGLISASILLLIILCPIFYYFKNKSPLSRFITAAFIALLVHSLFETPIYSVNVFPLFIILLSLNQRFRNV